MGPTHTHTRFVECDVQCHAEGGATKGGVSKCEQTQANADKPGQTQANAEAQTQANASKRKQTRANVDKRKQTLTPPFIAVFTPPFAIPLDVHRRHHLCDAMHFRCDLRSLRLRCCDVVNLGQHWGHRNGIKDHCSFQSWRLLYRVHCLENSGIHANSDDFPWKNPQRSIIIRVFRPFVRIMMNLCGFFQGKSSEFA